MVPSSSNYYNSSSFPDRSNSPSQDRTSPFPNLDNQKGRMASQFEHVKAAFLAIDDAVTSNPDEVNIDSRSNEGGESTGHAGDPNKKKRKNQGNPMTEEERQVYEESVIEKKLGSFCTVCGKVFRNRDALDFHIMTTKMPGHGVLQIQRMKSNYAFASMQVSAKLSFANRGEDEIKEDTFNEEPEVEATEGAATVQSEDQPSVSEQQEIPDVKVNGPLIDPKTGQCIVKEEPRNFDEAEAEKENNDITTITEMPVAVSIKAEPVGPDDNKQFKKPEIPLKKKKMGKNKIFKCMECQKGFKRQSKLIKHVMKRHQESLQRKTEEQVSSDIHELTKNARDSTGRWPCSVRIIITRQCVINDPLG